MSDTAAGEDRGADEARGDALVVFGLSGDLGEQRLVPAITHLFATGRLDVPVIGVGRSVRSSDELRTEIARHDVAASGAIDIDWVRGDGTERDTFDEIAARLGAAQRPVVYAAVPPRLFGELAGAMASSSLPEDTRLVLEKPFGEDAESARRLHGEIADRLGHDRFGDPRLRIVDHYLAKAAIENLWTARTSNALFDRALRAEGVGAIHVEMLEADDAAGRGGFYDDVGVVADVVQNHVLQLAGYALMPPPTSGTLESFRAARSDTLESFSIRPDSIVLGQYEGYLDHDGVEEGSRTATFASFTMDSDLDRWRGVPVHVRTGKALDRTCSRVVFELRDPTAADGSDRPDGATCVSFAVSPTPDISIVLRLLDPDGPHESGRMPTRLVRTSVCAPAEHHGLDAYATLLDDAMRGDRRHFATLDDVVAGWRIIEPVAALVADGIVPERYGRGSAGPPTSAPASP